MSELEHDYTPDESGIVTMPDGSRFHPGDVMMADGSQAAEAERLAGPPTSAGAPAEASVFGRVVSVPVDGSQVSAVWTPTEGTESPWTVCLQVVSPSPLPQPGGDGGGVPANVRVHVQWTVGGASFSKILNLRSTLAVLFPVLARGVQVDLSVTAIGAGPIKIDVSVGVARGHLTSIERLCPTWSFVSMMGGIVAEIGGTGPGALLALIAIVSGVPVTVTPTAPLYPMLFDLAPALGAGALVGLVPFLVLTPVTGPGQVVALSDEFAAAFYFQKSLYFAWSTTPHVFTSPGAAVNAVVNVKVGA